MDIKRNDIIFVKCDAVVPNGSIQCFDRPAIVIQNDIGNEHAPTLIVLYLTGQIKRLHMPTHFILSRYEGLRRKTMAMAEQIATICKDDVLDVVGHLNEEDAAKVNYAIAASLALKEAY